MTRLLKLAALAVAVYAVATKDGRERLKRAWEAYSKEVASGSRPIEAVGTAVAAFVGLADDGPSNFLQNDRWASRAYDPLTTSPCIIPALSVYAVMDERAPRPTIRSETPSRRSSAARTPSTSSRRCQATSRSSPSYLRIEEREREAGGLS